ncbi:alpha/beta-hydrolase [Durotheca rogersii]|uniref:alpha/beta-hydrolase n=1 Tax=Durotheca rogersii TaxID=419775 RepID=UPI00221E7CD0|nr:alpha/beta-hydrolase [Durotheca rogersii]KAI5860071.1 alpha/beta-hydrolase [Durotheca rogersii]
MANIQPYQIAIPQSEVDRLSRKLADARLPREDGEDGDDWERGAPVAPVRRIATYWCESFNWRAFEQELNELPHFEATISVEGFNPFQLHFIHQRSTASDAIPLLFVHGWPGSFLEATKILPALAKSDKDDGPSFHVIVPSLPNFGFSGRIDRSGFGLKQYAEALHQLMQGLGYEQYVSQGGDWGYFITRVISAMYPESLVATHLNIQAAMPPTSTSPLAYARFLLAHLLGLYGAEDKALLRRSEAFWRTGSAYSTVHRQRPSTIGIALDDSPVGLLAWIYEKLVAWTDDYPWTDEEVCRWVSIYWFSRAGPGASVVIYHEADKGEYVTRESPLTPGVKIGYSYFPKEIFGSPRFWNHRLGDVVFEGRHERGGHFAAWERPEDLVADLRAMFGKGGGAYGVVKQPTAEN